MELLSIACSGEEAQKYFKTSREIVDARKDQDFTDVAAVVLTEDAVDLIDKVDETYLGLPIFLITDDADKFPQELREKVFHFMDGDQKYANMYTGEIEAAAKEYEAKMMPPFLGTLMNYASEGHLSFTTPGHHAGKLFLRHPAGRWLYNFFGDNLFRADLSSSDPEVGDLLTHGGAALAAEKHAAKVYNADKTYFVMNGTSTSNAIVTSAAIAPGDLVLFDRNNHKSSYIHALEDAGGIPIYLETERNPFGFIGGITDKAMTEEHIRKLIAKVDPERAKEERPIRLAIIELGTYDGSIYNARQVIDRIGHLCDYIQFDSAWVGYEQFIPMMKGGSPMLLDDLGPDDPGIFVTQSVHKQMAAMSQGSYIHKKDHHIKGQKRYITHKRFNNAYMKFTSTSPFYPMYASLDANSYIMQGKAGQRMWLNTVKLGIEARKRLFKESKLFTPFVPPVVNGKKWEDGDTDEMANNIDYFKFRKGEKWHRFEGYADNQYYVDPLKILIETPGISMETGDYEDFGVPANILANFLREHGIVPEKSDLNSIEFLLTPAETKTKVDNLVNQILRFEKMVEDDVDLQDVLPVIYNENIDRYRGYTIRQLCQEMHDFYKKSNAKLYQKHLFQEAHFPEQAMTPYAADKELIRNNAELVPLEDIVGRVALEGGLPYPPGILVIAPGERWSEEAQKYFLILQDGINNFPGFTPEIQGVYNEPQPDGKVKAYGYVLKDESVLNK